MKKGQDYIGYIDHVNFPNKGIMWYEEKTEDGEVLKHKISIKGVLPGQTVKFRLMKAGSNKKEGRLLEVVEQSSCEGRGPECPHFGICGGCSYQTMPYEEQLKLKETQVRKLMDAVIDYDYEWEGILGSPKEFAYRNKMEYSFGDEYKDGPLALGLHRKGSFYDLVTVSDCKIVDDDFNKIVKKTLQIADEYGLHYYHKMAHKGYLRYLLVRRAIKTGEILVHLVTSSQFEQESVNEQEFLAIWAKAMEKLNYSGTLRGVFHIVTDSVADAVIPEKVELLSGEEYFYEDLLGLKFRISSFSFFQTNSLGAEVLYNKAREYVGETKDKMIFDLYSGTGTIAQLLAPVAKKVIGVEIVPEAVEAAKENAKLNGLDNCEFIAGDVLKMLDTIEERPDFIVLDPPRDGIHPKALEKIIDYGVESMVYISCKPTSLQRDLGPLQEAGYRVKKICLVDMFPQSVNVETVVLLNNKFAKAKDFVQIGIDAEDYYRIKDAKRNE